MIRKGYRIIALLVLLSACSGESGDSKQVKSTIMRYNQLLAEGYRSLNMTPIQEVATAEQAQKVYHHMAALGEMNRRMESELKKIEFLEVNLKGGASALVRTRETWDFTHRKIKTGEVALDQKNFVYQLTYELGKTGGHWQVKNVTAMEQDKGQKNVTSSKK